MIGDRLTALVAGAVQLRARLEDALLGNRDMLLLESQLGGSPRRPMWRQLEDANFGNELAQARRALRAWLRDFDGLDRAETDLLAGLDLGIEALRRFDHGGDDGGAELESRPRKEELVAVQAGLEAAIACLRRFERALADYRPHGYR